MNLLDKLERKFGKYSIENLPKYISMFTAMFYIMSVILPSGSIQELLYLIPQNIMQGQIWRLVTFILVPPNMGPIFAFFAIYIYYSMATTLESEWGSFKLNVYYLIGMIASIIISLLFDVPMSGFYLNTSIFFAFAFLYPDIEFLIFFILPVKVKYLAFLSWLFVFYQIIFGDFYQKIESIISISNFLLFFGEDIYKLISKNKKQVARKNEFAKVVAMKDYFHKCCICGKTDKSDPDMDFRYCTSCEGDFEYCMDHLKNHEHKKNIDIH